MELDSLPMDECGHRLELEAWKAPPNDVFEEEKLGVRAVGIEERCKGELIWSAAKQTYIHIDFEIYIIYFKWFKPLCLIQIKTKMPHFLVPRISGASNMEFQSIEVRTLPNRL